MKDQLDISSIYQFGDQYVIDRSFDPDEMLKELERYKDKWSQYNPRKPHIKREGLCVINYTGTLGCNPALDSIPEYNNIHKTDIKEEDCDKITEVYKSSKILKSFFKDMLPWCIRTHFLKLGPGGFFPPHRDHTNGIQSTFRLIVPIKNCNPPSVRLILEDHSLYWKYGELYVLNTTKQHSLFNASSSRDSIWLVITAKLCKESIDFVATHLQDR